MSTQHPRAGLWSCGLSLYGWILPGPKWPPYWSLLRYQAHFDLYEILEIGWDDMALKEYLDVFMLYNNSRQIGLEFRGYGLWARTGSRLGVRVLYFDILKSPWKQFINANIGWKKKINQTSYFQWQDFNDGTLVPLVLSQNITRLRFW